MAEVSDTYQPKVGKTDGGDTLYIKEDGEFKFFDLNVTGTQLRSFFRARSTFNTWSQTSMATTSDPLALVPAYGYHVIKDIAAAESAYMSLSTALVGDELILFTEGGGSNGLFTLGFSGNISLYNVAETKLSSITIGMSGADGSLLVHLKCFTNTVWSIVEVDQKDAVLGLNANA